MSIQLGNSNDFDNDAHDHDDVVGRLSKLLLPSPVSATSSTGSTVMDANTDVVGMFKSLPSEIIISIFGYLDEWDLAHLSQSCKHLLKLITVNDIWMALLQRRSFNRPPPYFKTNNDVEYRGLLRALRLSRENWKSGSCRTTLLTGHTEPLSAVLFNGTKVISASYDSTLKVWSYEGDKGNDNNTDQAKGHDGSGGGLDRTPLTINSGQVECMQLDYTNNNVVVGNKSGTVSVWNVDTGSQVYSERGHQYYISDIKANYNSTIFCSGSKDKTIKVWDMKQHKLVQTIRFQKPTALKMEWCEHNRQHLLASNGNQLHLVDVETGQLVKSFDGHNKVINSFALQDNVIASGGGDTFINIWDIRESTCVRSITHLPTLYCIKVQPSHNMIVVGSGDSKVQCYRLDTGAAEQSYTGHTHPISNLHLNKDNIVSASLDGNLHVWNRSTNLGSSSSSSAQDQQHDSSYLLKRPYIDDKMYLC
ncbi:hypothetical protein SAMD00019534_082860, partial [Acytostelium subglobosum LB1]|uniref:hypothetical protein n=1 Tax=Acytostelium subglobosum LB1 TaxID=1410327 RepID=UPI000644E29E